MLTCNTARFPMPSEEPEPGRRGGTFPIEEASFTVHDDGTIVFFQDFTSGQATTQLQADYIVDRGSSLDDFEISEIRWSAPGEDNWRQIGPLTPMHWAAEELLKVPSVAKSFERWREDHTESQPYPEFDAFLQAFARAA